MIKRTLFFAAIFTIFQCASIFAVEVSSDEIKSLLGKIVNLETEIAKLKQQIESLNTAGNEVQAMENSDDKKAYDIALSALKDQKFAEAEQKFADFIAKYPTSALQSNAYFWYGESFFRRAQFDKAAIYYLKGYKQFPSGVKASDSLLKLGLSLGELNQKEEACKILTKLEKEFPKRASASLKRAKDASIKFGCK
jgi:tol-pal system protein YbgF